MNLLEQQQEKAIINISNMSCTSCAQKVEKSLKKVKGVKSAYVNFPLEKAYVEYNPEQLIFFAASVEAVSEHPLGEAIVEKAKALGIKLEGAQKFLSVTGKGVQGTLNGKKVMVGNRKFMEENIIDFSLFNNKLEQLENEGKTTVFVSEDDKLTGIIAVADTVKDDSIPAITEIEKMGIRTAMVTGDNSRTARAIGRQVGISEVLAEVLPDGKVDVIKKLQNKYGMVAMVGDGINDAPALKQANVGIAIGTGTDVAMEAADITLIRGELSGVISANILSKATFGKIKQNYFWAWIYNVIAIPAAFLGLLHPIIGAAAMSASSLNVVLNSMRLKKAKIEPSFSHR